MARERHYSAGLGIETGDRIVTAWGTGPYDVWSVSPARYISQAACSIVVFPWPVVDLVVVLPGSTNAGSPFFINEVHRSGERYFSASDEVIIEKGQSWYLAMSLFDVVAPDADPYQFQDGVNYDCLDGELWRCPKCGLDYNALTVPTVPHMIPGDPRGRRPYCPRCGHWPDPLYIARDGDKWSSYQLHLHCRMVEQYREHAPERIAYLSQPDPTPKRKKGKKNG